MGKIAGKNALIYFNAKDIGGQFNTWSINPTVSHIDTGTFGESWDSGLQGNPKWSASVSGFSDANGSTGDHDFLFDYLTDGDHVLLIYPDGAGSSKQYWYAVGHCTGTPTGGTRAGAITLSANFEPGVDGTLQDLVTAA